MSKKLSLELFENALDFISSAVKYVSNDSDVRSMKYAVLHLSAGVDLVLKYRLSKDHWSLLFNNIDKAVFKNLETGNFTSVNFQNCISRLENNCQITLEDTFKDSVKKLRGLRNKIEHFKIDESQESVKSIFCFVIDGILNFVQIELSDEELSKQENEYLKIIRNELNNWRNFVTHKLDSIQDTLNDFKKSNTLIVQCPRCSQDTVIIDEGANCLFCGYQTSGESFAEDYVSEILKINRYRIAKYGEDDPITNCFDCLADAFVIDDKMHLGFCCKCGENYDVSKLCYCSYCGELMVLGEMDICNNCIEHINNRE